MKKKAIYVILLVIVVLFFLNPNYTRFSEYSTALKQKERKVVVKRTVNGLVFSIYESQLWTYDDVTEEWTGGEKTKYLGFAMNFFKL